MKNQFGNVQSMVAKSSEFWREACGSELGGQVIEELLPHGRLRMAGGSVLVNLSSYSYLGLDEHGQIRRAAAEAACRYGINTSMSRMRGIHHYLRLTEERLGEWLNGTVRILSSCTAAAGTLIPALSAGVGLPRRPDVVVFDKGAHFSLNILKAQVADETTVTTMRHNAMDELEDICRKNCTVLYVADGVYSTGGLSPVNEILNLQQRYDLKVVFDDAHGLSMTGERGIGYVLSKCSDFPDNVFLVASLNKGFGAAGGIIAASRRNEPLLQQISLAGGPIMWSQRPTFANLGAVNASLDLHCGSEEIKLRQEALSVVLAEFDLLVPTRRAGGLEPIRFVSARNGDGIGLAKKLVEAGYYAAPLAFPIVPQGVGGVRIMLRSNMLTSDIHGVAGVLKSMAEEPT